MVMRSPSAVGGCVWGGPSLAPWVVVGVGPSCFVGVVGVGWDEETWPMGVGGWESHKLRNFVGCLSVYMICG